MAARILAVLAAVAMVVAAIAYRQSLDDGNGGDGGGNGDGDAAVVVCAAELGAVCDAVDGARVEPVVDTAKGLLGDDPVQLDAWIAPGPWAAMVDTAGTPAFASSQALARTPLVAVIRETPAACAAELTWKCVADTAAEGRNDFLVASDGAEGMGLFVRAAIVTALLGRSDYDRFDFETDPAATAFPAISRSLADARQRGAGSLRAFVITPGSVKVFLTYQAAAIQENAASRGLTIGVPTPEVSIEATVAFTSAAAREAVDIGALRKALEKAGWKPAAAQPPLNLPEPGVLQALRESVQ